MSDRQLLDVLREEIRELCSDFARTPTYEGQDWQREPGSQTSCSDPERHEAHNTELPHERVALSREYDNLKEKVAAINSRVTLLIALAVVVIFLNILI